MKRLFLLLSVAAIATWAFAQEVQIKQNFQIEEYTSVLSKYKNEFGDFEMPDYDDPFPYAVVRIILEGTGRDVIDAIDNLSLDLRSRGIEAKNTDTDNEILFLVPSSVSKVYLLCGHGCEKKLILDEPTLRSNRIYTGRVHYIPMQDPEVATTRAPKRQYFKFRITPADAIVEVAKEGNVFKPWQVEEGIASEHLDWGTYRYRISANRYHAEEGTITVSDTQTEKTVTLLPKFGWLSVTGSQNEQGAMVYATSATTQEKIQLGTIPVDGKELMAGNYTIEVIRDQYHPFTTSVVVAEGKKSATTVQLKPTFGWLSINGDATSKGAFVYVTNQKTKERMQWGTIPVAQKSLTAGEYLIDIYKDKYKDYSTTITIAENKSHTLTPSLISNFSQIALQTKAEAEIWLDNKRLGSGRWTGTLEIGKYVIETRLAGHKSAYTNVEITTSSTGKTFTLNDPIPMYSTLIVNGSPADATVYVDGNRVGVSPLVVNDMLVGEHTVRVTKSGYQKQELKVNLQENKEKTVKYSLKKGVVRPAKPFPADPVTIGDLIFRRYNGNEYFVKVDNVVDKNRMTDVVIPETITWGGCEYSVVAIGSSAFSRCVFLKSIKIPESVIAIGDHAFAYCKKLESIVIPEGITKIKDNVFDDCSSLKSVKLPTNITAIGSYAFSGCSALDSILLPDSLEIIGSNAFDGCSSLKSITIPEKVESWGYGTFDDCSSLKSVQWNSKDESWWYDDSPAFGHYNSITSITFGEGIERIPNVFCKSMDSLKIVTLPASLKEIGADAFLTCDEIERVNYMGDIASWCNIDFKINWNGYDTNPLNRGCHLYIGGKEVTDLVIPEGVKEIKDYAFESGEYITSVTLPQSLTHIGRSAFEDCGMTSVVLPQSLTHIGSRAFKDCGMTSIVIPENVCTIEGYAFGDLQSVTLGRGVKSIGKDAFGDPKNNKKLRIYVPAGMKKEYCARKGFEIYKSKIKEIKE